MFGAIRQYRRKLDENVNGNFYSYYVYKGEHHQFSGIDFVPGNKYLISFRAASKKEYGKIMEPRGGQVRIFVKQQSKDIPILYMCEDTFNRIWHKCD